MRRLIFSFFPPGNLIQLRFRAAVSILCSKADASWIRKPAWMRVRNVGIRDGKIVRISSDALSGTRVIHATGLVVAPGFIDLHQHGQDMESQRVKALDGVTTALELEIGVPDVAQFLKSKEGHSLIHYGTCGQPCGGAGSGVRRAFARLTGQDPCRRP